MGSKRYTNDKDLNKVIQSFVERGWSFTRNGKGGQPVLVPPPEVLAANPSKTPYVAVHTTPSDHRAVMNTAARLRSYIDPRPAAAKAADDGTPSATVDRRKYFCVTCGAAGPEFPTAEERDTHVKETHFVEPMAEQLTEAVRAPHLWSAGNLPSIPKRICIVCDKPFDARALPRHMKSRHPAEWDFLGCEMIRGAQLVSDELKARLSDFRAVAVVEEPPLAEVIELVRTEVATTDRLIDTFFDGAFKVRSVSDFARLQGIADDIDRLVGDLS